MNIQFHLTMYIGHHKKKMYPWHLWFDYLSSSFPTLVYCSMLSVLLLFFSEIHYRSKMQHVPLLRPTFLFLNFVALLLYGTVAFLTFQFGAYKLFRRCTYSLLGTIQGALAFALACRGHSLARKLRARQDGLLSDGSAGQGQSSAQLIRSIQVVCTLLPVTELVRCGLDISYVEAESFWKCGLHASGGIVGETGMGKTCFVVLAKLFIEWLPSVVLLLTFRPRQSPTTDSCDVAVENAEGGAVPGPAASVAVLFDSVLHTDGLVNPASVLPSGGGRFFSLT